MIWVQVFKNGPSEIRGRQLLKKFAWPILEYFDSYKDRDKEAPH